VVKVMLTRLFGSLVLLWVVTECTPTQYLGTIFKIVACRFCGCLFMRNTATCITGLKQ